VSVRCYVLIRPSFLMRVCVTEIFCNVHCKSVMHIRLQMWNVLMNVSVWQHCWQKQLVNVLFEKSQHNQCNNNFFCKVSSTVKNSHNSSVNQKIHCLLKVCNWHTNNIIITFHFCDSVLYYIYHIILCNSHTENIEKMQMDRYACKLVSGLEAT